jgi:hypothetical protein
MRRVHLCGHTNILKRLLVHTAAFNLGLILRTRFGKGTPRGLQGFMRAFLGLIHWLPARFEVVVEPLVAGIRPLPAQTWPAPDYSVHHMKSGFATGS